MDNIACCLDVGAFKISSKRASVSFNYYEKLISWAKHGLRHMERMCKQEIWCSEKFKLVEQGMGVFGNALVLCSFYTKNFKVVPEPVVQYVVPSCPIRTGTIYDVGILMDNDTRFIVLIEVKLYKKSREGIPSFPNVEHVYEDIPKPSSILKRCRAIPLGILLEANPLPKRAKIPPYIIRVNKVMGRRAVKNIYEAVMGWLKDKQIVKTRTS